MRIGSWLDFAGSVGHLPVYIGDCGSRSSLMGLAAILVILLLRKVGLAKDVDMSSRVAS